MSHVDLCSGIGGFALGFEWAGLSKPVLFCDIEPWSRKVLQKHWPDVPIAEDVKELANDPDRFIPRIDPRNTILTSGYPCQPWSVAGARRGTSDSRHIYPHISEIIARKRPAFVVLENVFGHLSLGLDEVLNDLANKDYAARAFIFPSGAIVGAPHHRNRIFIIAKNVGNSEHDGSSAATVSGKHREDDARGAERQSASEQSEGASEPGHHANVGNAGCVTKGQSRNGLSEERLNSGAQGQWSVEGHRLADTSENVADTDNEGSQGRLSGRQGAEWQGEHGHARCSGTAHRQPAKDWWAVEPAMGRVADGLPKGLDRFDGWEREPADIPRVATGVKDRVSRLRGLGNAIVPQIAMQIGLTIKAVRDG
jgi:DNA (cytosine-5)-methyltransferase 1